MKIRLLGQGKKNPKVVSFKNRKITPENQNLSDSLVLSGPSLQAARKPSSSQTEVKAKVPSPQVERPLSSPESVSTPSLEPIALLSASDDSSLEDLIVLTGQGQQIAVEQLATLAQNESDVFTRTIARTTLEDTLGPLKSTQAVLGHFEGTLAFARHESERLNDPETRQAWFEDLRRNVGDKPISKKVFSTLQAVGRARNSKEELKLEIRSQLLQWDKSGQIAIRKNGEKLPRYPERDALFQKGEYWTYDGRTVNLDQPEPQPLHELRAAAESDSEISKEDLGKTLEKLDQNPNAVQDLIHLLRSPNDRIAQLLRPHAKTLLRIPGTHYAQGVFDRETDHVELVDALAKLYGEDESKELLSTCEQMLVNGSTRTQDRAYCTLWRQFGIFTAMETNRVPRWKENNFRTRFLESDIEDSILSPTQGQADRLAASLCAPAKQRVFDSYVGRISALNSIAKRHPHLMKSWKIPNGEGKLVDYREAVLDRYLRNDLSSEGYKSDEDLVYLTNPIPYKRSDLLSEALPEFLFRGKTGSKLQEQCLAELEDAVGDASWPRLAVREQRLLMVLTQAQLTETQSQRLAKLVEGHKPDEDTRFNANDSRTRQIVQNYHLNDFWRGLKESPVRELPQSAPEHLNIKETGFSGYIVHRYLRAVSENPFKTHRDTIKALNDVNDKHLVDLKQILDRAAQESKLGENFSLLNHACQELGSGGIWTFLESTKGELPLPLELEKNIQKVRDYEKKMAERRQRRAM